MKNTRVYITNLQSDAWVKHLKKVGQGTGKKEVSHPQLKLGFESPFPHVEQNRQRSLASR
ncbi:MAG: hypothetical protein GKR93_13680 [Gammaproteobacteria bacterium]|nr:hypothetical protein [Gammaproteobacteria bacterium]